MSSGDGPRTIYGREQQVADLLSAQARVIVISGDHGVGKTRVLEEVGGRFNGLAPAPVRVGNAPAALQAGLLEALGAAASLIASDEGAARRVGKLLVEGGRRLARVKANEIGTAVARIILGVARDRVGDNVTDVLVEYFEQVRDAATDDLASRIRQTADPDVIHAIAGLAGEVAAAGGRTILLSLDDVQHLKDDDRGRLMDLGPILPTAVSVACTFTSDSRADESVLDEYRLAGITIYPLYGLDLWAVKQWLAAEGLEAGIADEVWRRTNGYGLVVADAIRLLKAGENVADALYGGRQEVISAATRQALRELDASSTVAALKLSVLPTPLPRRNAAAYLEVDPASWAVTEGSLIDSHIFVPGDPPWFHDQRRILLRQQVQGHDLVPYLRAAGAQLSALAQETEASADTLVQYAAINDELARLGAADAVLSALAQLDDDALAVLGALIELTDGNSPVVDAERALLYARETFRARGDLPAALSHVSAQGLAVTASNEYISMTAAKFGSAEARLYIIGKIGAKLGRMPLPRIASLVFSSHLSGPLGSFRSANYGVGEPPLEELARRSVKLQARPPGTQHVRSGRKRPSLLLRGLFGDTPFFAAVAYDEVEERDIALSKMQTLSAEPVFGRPVVLITVVAQPDAVVPPRRLARAFERALGISIGSVINSFDVTIQGPLITAQDGIEQRVETLNLLASLSNKRERQVTGHDAPHYGLLRWTAPAGDGELTAVVTNAHGVIALAEVPVPVLQRFDRVALAQLSGLQPDQVIGYMQERAGRLSQPTDLQAVVNEVMRHSRKIVAYNQHQPRKHVPGDPSSLQDLIQEQLDEREALARTIATSFGRALPVGHDIYLLIDPRIRHPEMGPGAGQDATIIQAPMRGTSPRVQVAIGPPLEVPYRPAQDWRDATLARWRDVFAAPDVTFKTSITTSALEAVAGLLGHMFNEVWLDEPTVTQQAK
jgi:hypothetical protein